MTHTKGPWKEWHGDIVADGDALSDFDDYVIAGIGKSYGSRSSVYSPIKITKPEGKANARRIVACVNALEGFDIAAIEAGVVGDLVEAAGTVLRGLNERIDAAPLSSVPVFDGTAALHDVLAKIGQAT